MCRVLQKHHGQTVDEWWRQSCYICSQSPTYHGHLTQRIQTRQHYCVSTKIGYSVRSPTFMRICGQTQLQWNLTIKTTYSESSFDSSVACLSFLFSILFCSLSIIVDSSTPLQTSANNSSKSQFKFLPMKLINHSNPPGAEYFGQMSTQQLSLPLFSFLFHLSALHKLLPIYWLATQYMRYSMFT